MNCIMKPSFRLLPFVFGVLLISLIVAPAQSENIRPNIVVFLVDDMGVMDTSLPFLTDSKGNPKRYPLNDHYRTPNMERLAEQGIRFNQFYAMSVCSPTRISIMTGQNAARHAATNWIRPESNNAGPQGPPDWNWEGLNKKDITLPGLLRQEGYRTIHIGKAHFGPRDFEGSEPLNLGFDINIGGAEFGAPGSYYAEDRYGWGTKRETHAVPHLYAYHGSDTHLSEALTLEAKKVLTSVVHADESFYLYFAHYAVHSPFQSDPRFAQNYLNSAKSERAQAFATMIEGMDKSLGDLLDHLNELGVAENTLILFLGDNGSDGPLGHQHEVACAAPLRGRKGAHYEGGMRVPFIAAWAKLDSSNPVQRQLPIPTGVIQSQVASVCDLFPTLAGLLSVDLPNDHAVDGDDLTTLLTGKKDSSRVETFLMHYPHGPHRSDYFTVYREGDWKVIYHFFPTEVSGGSHYQLFNLKKDPFELTDVTGKQPKVLKRLMRGLAESLESHEALYPVNKKDQPVLPIVP
jgi:arylsulfatase A-like enzyme